MVGHAQLMMVVGKEHPLVLVAGTHTLVTVIEQTQV